MRGPFAMQRSEWLEEHAHGHQRPGKRGQTNPRADAFETGHRADCVVEYRQFHACLEDHVRGVKTRRKQREIGHVAKLYAAAAHGGRKVYELAAAPAAPCLPLAILPDLHGTTDVA